MRNTTLKLASLALAGFGVVMSGSAMAATEGAAADAGTKSSAVKAMKTEKVSKGKDMMSKGKEAMADHWMKVGGLAQFDQVFFDGDNLDAQAYPSGSNIRRAYLAVNGGFSDAWTYALRTDFAGNLAAAGNSASGSSVLDAYLSYHPVEHAYVAVGQKLPSFGIENETADHSLMFLERSLVSTAFRPAYSIGVFGGIHGDMLNLTASVYQLADKVQQLGTLPGSDPIAFASRLTFAPIMENDEVLHFGASYLYQDQHNSHNSISFTTAPEAVARGTAGFASPANANGVSSYGIYGLEAAAQWHSFNLQGEYFHASINQNVGADLSYHGYYAQLGYVLTGETRPYCFKTGAFHHVKPTSKDGAWELAVRHSRLAFAVAEHNTTVGLNWWVNDNVSFAANYIRAAVGQTGAGDKHLDIVGLRGQFVF